MSLIYPENNKAGKGETVPSDQTSLPKEPPVETAIQVIADCYAIFRIVDPNKTEIPTVARNATFHVPSFPSVEAIDPSEKVYEKREELDADMVELLLCIDWKINLLIKMLSPLHDSDLYPYRALIFEMGMKAIKISTAQPLNPGTFVEFHCVLPVLPFKETFLRGEVIRSLPAPEEYEVAIDTENLREFEREHLIHYMVKRQFQLKREQSHNKQ